MKELFLLKQRAEEIENFFEFKPYKYGPHSHDVTEAIDGFIESGFVQTTPGFGSEMYSLTPDGVEYASSIYKSLDRGIRRALVDIKIRYNSIPLHELLDYVYEHYPYYASESEYEGPTPE